MKATLFISNGLQVDLGIYIASGEIERTIKNSKVNQYGEYEAIVKVQGKNIVVTSDDNISFDVDNIATRRAN